MVQEPTHIVFTSASSAEISALPMALQLEILREFDVMRHDFLEAHPQNFGRMRRDGREVFRYRAKDYRIYFERNERGVRVLRVLHKNTLKDFLYRSALPISEDEALENNPTFWKMIDASLSGTGI